MGAWIEIWRPSTVSGQRRVAPLVGAWIEIACFCGSCEPKTTSLPLWERGLKSGGYSRPYGTLPSLPLWERGLKFRSCAGSGSYFPVAPLVGAWIEIFPSLKERQHTQSLPLWERGLKYRYPVRHVLWRNVAPLVGAWIEIHLDFQNNPVMIVAPLVGAWIEIHLQHVH